MNNLIHINKFEIPTFVFNDHCIKIVLLDIDITFFMNIN
jgi:hypothetical protein